MIAHVFVTGSVQGVGFRQFIKQHAVKLGLHGWVRNCSDGSVEAKFSGSQETIEQMISLCKKGTFLAEVKEISVVRGEEQETYNNFTILQE